jgi:hypothetical protein
VGLIYDVSEANGHIWSYLLDNNQLAGDLLLHDAQGQVFTIQPEKTRKQPKGYYYLMYQRVFNISGEEKVYIDIAEDFILYHNLYEKNIDEKTTREYYCIRKNGNLETVIVIEPKKAKVRMDYLKKYLAAKKLNFARAFDFHKFIDTQEYIFIKKCEKEVKEKNYVYFMAISRPSDVWSNVLFAKQHLPFNPKDIDISIW